MIKPNLCHYILSVHSLPLEKQQRFCDLLNDYKINREQDF